MSLSLEAWRTNNGGYCGGADEYSIYVPDIEGNIYIFGAFASEGAIGMCRALWNGADITTLSIYQEDENTNLFGDGDNEGWIGYFKIPDADKGSTGTLTFDWYGGNTNTGQQWVMISGIDEVVDINRSEYELGASSSPVSETASLGYGEMLFGMFMIDNDTPTTTNGYTLTSTGGGNISSIKSIFDWAKDGGKSGELSFSYASGADLWYSVWKLVPDQTLSVRPFILSANYWYDPTTARSLSLNDYVDKLVVVSGTNAETSAADVTATYNSVGLDSLAQAGKSVLSGSTTKCAILSMDNPPTGASYALDVNNLVSYGHVYAFGLCNANGLRSTTDVESDGASLSVPTLSTGDGDLIIDMWRVYDNYFDQISAVFQNGNEPYEPYSTINYGNGLHCCVARGTGSNMQNSYDRNTATKDHSYCAVVFEASPGGGNAPLPVMLGANF